MLRDAPVALAVVSAQGDVLEANAAFVATVGDPSEGRQLAALLGCDPSVVEAELCLLRASAGGGGPLPARGRTPPGEVSLEPCAVRLGRWPSFGDLGSDLGPALLLQVTFEPGARPGPLQRALEQVSDGLMVVGRDWRIVYANRATLELVGSSREELIGQDAWQRFDYLLGTELEKTLRRVMAQHEPAELEFLTPLRRRWLLLRAFPSEEGMTLTFSNRTAEHEMLSALRSSMSRFRAIFEHSLEGILLSRESGEILAANPAACRLVQRTEAELQALGRRGLVAPEDERLAAMLAERNRNGWTLGELILVRPDGTRFPVELGSSVFQDVNGERLSIIIFHDLTERTRAQQVLEFLVRAGKELGRSLDHETTLASLVRLVVPEYADLCMVDLLEGTSTRRVALAHKIPGEAAKLRNRSFELGRDYPWVGISRVLQTQQPELVEEVSLTWISEAIRNPDHREAVFDVRPISVMHVPLVDRGQTLGVLTLALVKDNPRRFRASDLPLAQGLADLAAQALHHARLFAEAVEARQVRDDILAVVSHDLRNPLNTIGLCIARLARLHPDPGFEQLRASVRRANRLIDDLLLTSTIEHGGHIALQRAPVELAPLIEEVIGLHRALAQDREITLELSIEEGLPTLPLDRHRMIQLLENLVGNALRFTPVQGRIVVAARRSPEEVELTVEDSGTGISEADLPHLFDRYWRGREKGHAGVGLGLAIAKGIAELHGGSIRVENVPGGGARFCVRLPLGPTVGDDPRLS